MMFDLNRSNEFAVKSGTDRFRKIPYDEASARLRRGEDVYEKVLPDRSFSRSEKAQIPWTLVTVTQYGIRWPTGKVFTFASRDDAEKALEDDGRGVGVLVVHEGVPHRSASEWTPWREVEQQS